MKIVLAFDSFKGCISAHEACHTAAEAIREVLPLADIVQCPLSDGGEGLVDCVSEMLPVERITVKAHDPLMNPIEASYVISPSLGVNSGISAYMEMASTSGLTLVQPDRRNPMLATTYGVGEMIIDAIKHGCTNIVMGIGGSATCDAGRGMILCLQDNGLINSHGAIADCKLSDCRFVVACDVTNPLYGPNGAAYVFAPQKGATPTQVIQLDQQLQYFARETETLGLATPEIAQYPGAGAAGGLGYALMTYLNATLKSGIDIILDIRHFDDIIKDADIVITGEGKSDSQTLMGKVPQGVLRRSKSPVWLFSGAIEDTDQTLANSFAMVKSINEGDCRSLDELKQPAVAKENMHKTIMQTIKTLSR